jgi:hypothetical protein
MEDILDVYTRKHDKKRPLVCMDEVPKQLIGEVRAPIPASKGKPARFDTEYKRNGTCVIFMFSAPLEGWRRAEAAERRTKTDFAHQIKKLVTVDFPEAEKIVLVMDNLNTHTIGSLYKTFLPEEARMLRDKLEIHYTPKHGSWLNIAEIELGALTAQCLGRRIPSIEALSTEIKAWNRSRNESCIEIKWQFTTDDARIKLHRLYPNI